MAEFFERRLDRYDEHILKNIESADEFYYYDTSLTIQHETEALYEATFSKIEIIKNLGATHTLVAYK